MVVEEDDGHGVKLKSTLCDHSAVDFAAVDGAVEQALGCQDVVLGDQEDGAEDLMRQMGAYMRSRIDGVK